MNKNEQDTDVNNYGYKDKDYTGNPDQYLC